MVIWMLLTLLGAVLIVSSVIALITAIVARSRTGIIVCLAVPAIYVIGYGVLLELDRRSIAEEMRKNGGEIPGNVW